MATQMRWEKIKKEHQVLRAKKNQLHSVNSVPFIGGDIDNSTVSQMYISKLYLQGLNPHQISSKLNISYSKIITALKSRGIKTNYSYPQKIYPVQIPKAHQAHQAHQAQAMAPVETITRASLQNSLGLLIQNNKDHFQKIQNLKNVLGYTD